uniref:Fucolectin tachylectin-4 pentraxin-1 domain-containing protein n=1 Tax=Branchiostoma floridae TaxID=7739 RepID=C3Z1N7_BRAFL|eukprot:XP_002597392.1 hypothetical protein BRAFLDRAFT_69323 [Branchiostoma floridae]
MKKAVGVGVPLVLILAVAAYLAVTWYGKNGATKVRMIKKSIPLDELDKDISEALKAAAAKDAPPTYVPDKRFLGSIAKLAGDLLGKAKAVLPGQLKQTIDTLGKAKNMGPDIMSDSVKHEQEVTGEVEKEVAEKTIENLFGGPANVGGQNGNPKRGAPPPAKGAGPGEMKAEIDFIEQKGMVQEDMFAPPGMKMKVDVEKSPKKQNERDNQSPPPAFSYPMGMGGTLMNGCFGTGYVRGDPCYKAKRPMPPCQSLMEGCNYIGVGFDGRGDYSSTSRRKSVIQRKCLLQKKYHKEEVPDQMNVHGIYDTVVSSQVFESRSSYRHSLQMKAGVSFSGFGFQETFLEWLKSIPAYPKPIDMFMGTMSELLNLNFKMLFPFDVEDAADGCFSKNLLTEEETMRKYYEVPVLVDDGNETTTVNEKRYCEDSTISQFQQSMDQKRLALERAIAIYMEEGPIPTTDFHLSGGKPGCQTDLLSVKGGDSGVSHPSWLDLINGDTYKIFFDLKRDVNYKIRRSSEALVVYSDGRWNCHAPEDTLHVYDSYLNGGSGNTDNKKVSCYGFVMTYDESNGKMVVTEDDYKATIKELGRYSLRPNTVNSIVARVEYVSPLEHSQSSSSALASIMEAPCEVKWSNSYQIKPAEVGGKCLYFVAASAGDIFVVFSAIPRDKTTWYHLQISFQGVALYKGMKLVKYEGAKNARSLGDRKLFRPYFICIEENMEEQRTDIRYGIGSDNSEKGLIYMIYSDNSEPLGILFYSFGSGEKDIEIMDARVIEGGATGQMECTGGTTMVDGRCVEDCHPECNGCTPGSPGSQLDTECVECKHYSMTKLDGTTQCVPTCPPDLKPSLNEMKCRLCPHYAVRMEDQTLKCVSACPAYHAVGDDGLMCEPFWRDDGKCGSGNAAPGKNPGQCDPSGAEPCCSPQGQCGASAAHCTCSGCKDYRWLDMKTVRVVGQSGYPHASGGVTYGAEKTVDGNVGTWWNAQGTNRWHNNWYIAYDLGAPFTVTKVALINFGDSAHDVKKFQMLKSERKMPWSWSFAMSAINVRDSTDALQEFGGFRETAQYWLFIVKETHSGYQPWLKEVQFHGFTTVVNVAKEMEASQTSSADGGVARLAVDGNIDTNWAGGSCTRTTAVDNPVWKVDLSQSYAVKNVVIFNNDDRINPFNIHIGDNEDVSTNPKCGGDHRFHRNSNPREKSVSMNVPCAGMRGRYVGIRAPGSSRVLSLCEVRVFSGNLSLSSDLGQIKRERIPTA